MIRSVEICKTYQRYESGILSEYFERKISGKNALLIKRKLCKTVCFIVVVDYLELSENLIGVGF